MTRIISITIAIIIMLTAGANTEMIAAAKPTYIITATVKGKWFKSKKALRKHVDKVMKYWADKEESGEITREEYYENCPSGYEAWSCPCGKWTGNFKYN